MIFFDKVSLAYGAKTIFDGVSLAITAGARLGVVGDNGTGKTTMLRMITGEVTPDDGSVSTPNKNITVGFLPQELVELSKEPIIQYLKHKNGLSATEARLSELEALIAQAAQENAGTQALRKVYEQEYELRREEYTNWDGYAFEARAKQLLKGLGFGEKDYGKSCLEFSGGWQMRIVLASILLLKPNIMLMDEPTNHLDTEAMEWLESYLKDYRGALVVVSHDRYFLDKTVSSVLEVVNGKIVVYKGNYSYYLDEKQRRQAVQRKEIALQKQKMLQTKEFVERFRAKATKARQAQAKLKVLEAMMPLEIEKEARALRLSFPPPPPSAKVICEAAAVSQAYGSQRVFSEASFSIGRGQKIAIVGANGEGKSTLMRLLAGREKPSEGRINYGEGVKIGFFCQESALEIGGNKTVWESVADVGVANERQKRSLLGAFLFSGDDVHKSTSVLSGGEKSRLALLKLLLTEANLLIMDEPTNHLDQKTRAVLLQALSEYAGALVIVSHDRDLVDKLAQRLLEVKNGVITEYAGNYSYFMEKRQSLTAAGRAARERTAVAGKTKAAKRQEALLRNERYRLQQATMARVVAIEDEIVVWEAKKRESEVLLCEPSILRDGAKVKAINTQYEHIQAMLVQLSQAWEKASDELTKADVDDSLTE